MRRAEASCPLRIVLRSLVLLALSLAGCLAQQAPALAYRFGEPDVKPVGPETTVFDWGTSACEPSDIPDIPARAFRDRLGRVQLIDSHYVTRRMVGPDLSDLHHGCEVVMRSDDNPDPAAFDDKEWIGSVYTPDGQTIYALLHVEYQGWNEDPGCPAYHHLGPEILTCWYNAIALGISTNGGESYEHAPPPAHLVASLPYRYVPGAGPYGVFAPTNIVYRPDGYYYSMVGVAKHEDQEGGVCLMRTRNLADPASWRAWDGTGFGVSFVNPYQQATEPPGVHICLPILPDATAAWNLTYSTYFRRFVLVGGGVHADPVTGKEVSGFYYSFSDDLIRWSEPRLLMEAELPWTHRCDEANPVRDASLLDPNSESRNFDTIGRRAFLYFTRFNYGYDGVNCWGTLDRDLILIPIEFSGGPKPGHGRPHQGKNKADRKGAGAKP